MTYDLTDGQRGADFCGAESSVNLGMILKKKSGVSAVIRVRENPDEADMTPPRIASMPIGGCALTLACAALMITGPASALWVANYYSARNPLRLSSLVILGVVARMFRCATRSSCWCT